MRKIILLLLLTIIVNLPKAHATVHVIEVGPNQTKAFVPDSITVTLGDTVKWVWKALVHTTTSDVGGIPVGATPWDANLDATDSTFMYEPMLTGIYNYHCTYHVSMGMVGKFVVVSPASVNNVANTQDIELRPNPAKGEFIISTGNDSQTDLLDLSGKVIMHLQPTSVSGKDLHYSTAGIAEGLYMLRIATKGHIVTKKFQVVK
jgi:plastocyanin